MDRVPPVERDPFSDTSDPAAYVPRIATEAVLVELEMALRDGVRVLCLEGPPGSGKSILLNVLGERFTGEFRALRIPYPKLEPDEFCHWGLAALDAAPAEDPERALAERIANGAAAGDPPLVWIIDDADCLPVPTLRSLFTVQRTTGAALRLLFARSGELPAEELDSLGVRPVTVALEGEMGREEMAHYVRARLDRVDADAATRASIEAAQDELFARSRGNPRRLHAAASVLLCFGRERLAALPGEPLAAPAPSELVAPTEIPAVPDPDPERISIESLVAEAVAAEQPIEELAAAEPTPREPEPHAAAPRKRHRLRRLGRR